MLCFPLIAAADVVGVLLVEAMNVKIFFVKTSDVIGVFDDQKKLGLGTFQCICQTRLVIFAEGATFVIGKIRIIRRIQKNKVIFSHIDFMEEFFKVHTAQSGVPKQATCLTAEHMGDLCSHIFSVVGHSAVWDVKLPVCIISEHGTVAVFPDKIKHRCSVSLAERFCSAQ